MDRNHFYVCLVGARIPVSVREGGYPEISKLDDGVKGRQCMRLDRLVRWSHKPSLITVKSILEELDNSTLGSNCVLSFLCFFSYGRFKNNIAFLQY